MSESPPTTPEQWFALLYGELRTLATAKLRLMPPAGVSPTTLVHELYLNLNGRMIGFPDQSRFLGYAARAMRGLIIDFARERQALKRGAGFEITHLTGQVGEHVADDTQLVRLSEALDALAAIEPLLAELVDLRYFCGLTHEEIAAIRGVSVRTVQRDWEKARLLLYREIEATAA